MIDKYPRSQSFLAFGVGLLLLGAPYGRTSDDTDEGAGPEFRETLLRPVKLVGTSGDVQNAQALVEGGFTTLSWGGCGTAPQVIVDYGVAPSVAATQRLTRSGTWAAMPWSYVQSLPCPSLRK